MIATFTLPLLTDDGFEFGDIECGVEIDVTYRGCRAQTYGPADRCYPAEGPEWTEEAYYVECRYRDPATNKFVSKWCPAPADMEARIKTYLATRDGQYMVADQISEAA